MRRDEFRRQKASAGRCCCRCRVVNVWWLFLIELQRKSRASTQNGMLNEGHGKMRWNRKEDFAFVVMVVILCQDKVGDDLVIVTVTVVVVVGRHLDCCEIVMGVSI